MPEPYPPIGDYAIIGDCRSAALVSTSGSIDWCCWPRFDSPAFFARILDWKRGGFFSIQPAIPFRSSRQYIPGTNVLVTTFETNAGRARLTDLMPVMPEKDKHRYLLPLREISRRVEGIEGEVPIRLEYAPRPDFASVTPSLVLRSEYCVACRGGREIILLGGAEPFSVQDGTATAQFLIHAGEARAFSLSYSDEAPAVYPAVESLSEEKLRLSIDYWRSWVSDLDYHGPQREAVQRSALVLKLLLYAPSGAFVAAPTTSLPEQLGGVRNWDYRYCWLRDASSTARALYQLGFQKEGEAYCGWLLHATSLTHPGLKILYDVYGRTRLDERRLEHLEGYRGSGPVRVGNQAHRQFQLDVYGELLGALEHHFQQQERLDHDTRKLVRQIADLVSAHWEKPDHGIWEVRSGKFQHVHGKVLAWSALDCVVRLAEEGMVSGDRDRWSSARLAIRDRILTQGFNRDLGAFVSILSGDTLDASLMTIPMTGFLPASDPRILGTIGAIRARLSAGDLIYRYRGLDDGLPGNEGAFLACSFWLINALALAGQVDQATGLFERMVQRANDVGLYSEEIDPASGELLGNFPQGLTHIALINAALALQQADQGKESFPRPQAR